MGPSKACHLTAQKGPDFLVEKQAFIRMLPSVLMQARFSNSTYLTIQNLGNQPQGNYPRHF